MARKVLSSDSERLTFICGLGWPDLSRYYLSQRRLGVWEFWEQPAGSQQARMIFGWMADGTQVEAEVAKRLLGDYLGTFRAAKLPRGETVQGLLSIREIERVLRVHSDRGQTRLLNFPPPPRPSGPSVA